MQLSCASDCSYFSRSGLNTTVRQTHKCTHPKVSCFSDFFSWVYGSQRKDDLQIIIRNCKSEKQKMPLIIQIYHVCNKYILSGRKKIVLCCYQESPQRIHLFGETFLYCRCLNYHWVMVFRQIVHINLATLSPCNETQV